MGDCISTKDLGDFASKTGREYRFGLRPRAYDASTSRCRGIKMYIRREITSRLDKRCSYPSVYIHQEPCGITLRSNSVDVDLPSIKEPAGPLPGWNAVCFLRLQPTQHRNIRTCAIHLLVRAASSQWFRYSRPCSSKIKTNRIVRY